MIKAGVKELLSESSIDCRQLEEKNMLETVSWMTEILKENHQIAEGFHTLLVSLNMPKATQIIEEAMAEGGQMIGTRVTQVAPNDRNMGAAHKGNTKTATYNTESMGAANDGSIGDVSSGKMESAHGGSTGAERTFSYSNGNCVFPPLAGGDIHPRLCLCDSL